MQAFNVNRNSWHYKFNMNFFNAHGESHVGRHHWEAKHNNFCAYWRATMFRMFWSAFLALFGLGFFGMIAGAIYQDPVAAVITFGAFITLIATGIGAGIGISAFQKRKRSDAPRSLFVQKYVAYKSKVCPQVTYD